jgi:Spy/CpxP family protein refolding chaperone
MNLKVTKRELAAAVAGLGLGLQILLICNPYPSPSWAQQALQQGQEQSLFEELNLSSDQTRQVQGIRQQYQQRIKQAIQNLRQSRQALGELMRGTASDERLRQQFRELQTQEQQLAQLRFESLLAIRAVLTPEQRRQLAVNMRRRPTLQSSPNRER